MKDNKEKQNRLWIRHNRIYRFFAPLISKWIGHKFNFSYDGFDPRSIEGPLIVIPNHSCAWDPLLMASAFSRRHMYFVASEHIMRMPTWGPVISFLVAPIPRKKASSGSGTVIACLRHLKAGHSICLFAEGEQSWDGVSGHVFPATGKLVKQSGATLVTYRLEGAFLSLPRWAKGLRRGRVFGKVAGVYGPDELAKMTAGEIDELIDRDIYFDVWNWQDSQPDGPVKYIPQKREYGTAARLEKGLFMCPGCRSIGTLSTQGRRISCGCGFGADLADSGFLDPPEPFRTIREWDAWETSELSSIIDKALQSGKEGEGELFSDGSAELSRVEGDHTDSLMAQGRLSLKCSGGSLILSACGTDFALSAIENMAPVLSSMLLFSDGKDYCQIRSEEANLRKYLLAWQHINKDN